MSNVMSDLVGMNDTSKLLCWSASLIASWCDPPDHTHGTPPIWYLEVSSGTIIHGHEKVSFVEVLAETIRVCPFPLPEVIVTGSPMVSARKEALESVRDENPPEVAVPRSDPPVAPSSCPTQ